MKMSWQLWVWVAILAVFGALSGYLVHWHWHSTAAGVVIGIVVFLGPIVVFTIVLANAMNSDI